MVLDPEVFDDAGRDVLSCSYRFHCQGKHGPRKLWQLIVDFPRITMTGFTKWSLEQQERKIWSKHRDKTGATLSHLWLVGSCERHHSTGESSFPDFFWSKTSQLLPNLQIQNLRTLKTPFSALINYHSFQIITFLIWISKTIQSCNCNCRKNSGEYLRGIISCNAFC